MGILAEAAIFELALFFGGDAAENLVLGHALEGVGPEEHQVAEDAAGSDI